MRDAATRAVYVQALLLAGEPLRGRDAEAMGSSLAALLDAGLAAPAEHQDDETTQEDA